MLITIQEIKTNTTIGGNVDIDKLIPLINDAQVMVLEPVLGTNLYNKIVDEFGSLVGDYLEMLNNYIKPVLWHSVYADYLRDGIVLAENTGIFTNSPENGTPSNSEDIKYKAKNAQSKADVYIGRLERYLCDKNIPEYNNQKNDYDVHPRDVNTISGWYLGSPIIRGGSSTSASSTGNYLELE